MSNTSLAVPTSFRALSSVASDAIDELLEANLGGDALRYSDLTFVKIPTGGGTRWDWQTKSGTEFSEKAITGLLVVVGRKEQTLWPHTESSAGSRPLLVSTDGVNAWKIGSDYGDLDANVIEAAKNEDGSYSVAKIPYFHWKGQGPGAVPPRAKSSRVIGILRENETSPVFIRLSQTSLKPVEDLLRGLTADRLFHFCAVVELTLERKKGGRADYAVVVAKKVGEISPEEGMKAKRLFTDPLKDIVCTPAELRAANTAAYEQSTTAAGSDVPF